MLLEEQHDSGVQLCSPGFFPGNKGAGPLSHVPGVGLAESRALLWRVTMVPRRSYGCSCRALAPYVKFFASCLLRGSLIALRSTNNTGYW